MSVIEDQTYAIVYPDLTTVLNSVVAKEIIAYDDDAQQPQSLTLGATSNLVLEAVNDVNVFLKGTGDFNVMTSTYENDVRTDTKILNITDSNNTTIVNAPSSRSIKLAPTDAAKTVQAGSLTVSDGNNYTYIDTTQDNGVYLKDQVLFDSNVVFSANTTIGGSLAVGGSLLSYGGLYGKNMNVWKDIPGTDSLTGNSIDRVGYALNIGSNNQLEFIKMFRYNDAADDANKTVRTRRVAVFDNKTSDKNSVGDATYLEFDALNGMDIVDSNGDIITDRLWREGDGESAYFTGAGGVVIGASAPSGDSNTRLEVVGGDVKVDGSIVPSQDITYDLGTPTRRWRELYLSGNTVYLGDVTISAQSDSLEIVNTVEDKVMLSTGDINNTSNVLFSETIPTLSTLSNYIHVTLTSQLDTTSNYVYSNLTDRIDALSNVAYNALPITGGSITGNLTVLGDFTVTGTETVCNVTSSNFNVESNLIVLNNGYTGDPAFIPSSGLRIDRGSSNSVFFVFEEASQLFKVGESNNLQTIATRQEMGVDRGVPYWDAATSAYLFDPQVTLPSPGTLAVQNIRVGAALTASNVTACNVVANTLNGSLTGNASSADAVTITENTQSTTPHYVTFVNNTSGHLAQQVSSTNLVFTPSSGTLHANNLSVPGLVGIGTASPDSNCKLHVYSSNVTNNLFEDASLMLQNAANGEVALAMKNSSVPPGKMWGIGMDVNSTNLNFGYYTETSAMTTGQMVLTANGDLGVGTSTPGFKLDVNATNFRLGDSVGKSFNISLGKSQGNTTEFATVKGIMMIEISSTTGGNSKAGKIHRFNTHLYNSLSPQLGWQRITPIFTTFRGGNMDWVLDMYSEANSDVFKFRMMRRGTDSYTDPNIYCQIICHSADATIDTYQIYGNLGTYNAPNYHTVALTVAGAAHVNVGIRSELPTHALTLGEDSAAKPGTNTWTITSDERLKENIQVADYALCHHIVSNLDLKYYKWRDDIEGVGAKNIRDRHMLGWIAQDVEAVFPKSVTTIPDMYGMSNVKMLNNDQVYACMYGAVKQMMREVDELRQQVHQRLG